MLIRRPVFDGAVCHQMSPSTFPEVSGKPLPDSGAFVQGPWNVIHGRTPDDDIGGPIRALAMRNALGITPAFEPHLATSGLCGTCHTIRLPVFPEVDRFRGDSPVHTDGTVLLSEAHEQDTYLEWLYSAYQNSNRPSRSIPKARGPARTATCARICWGTACRSTLSSPMSRTSTGPIRPPRISRRRRPSRFRSGPG